MHFTALIINCVATFIIILLLIKAMKHQQIKNAIMGLFWDLIQQTEIQKQGKKATNLEQRITALENELSDTKKLLRKTLITLENHLGKDIDGDGKLG